MDSDFCVNFAHVRTKPSRHPNPAPGFAACCNPNPTCFQERVSAKAFFVEQTREKFQESYVEAGFYQLANYAKYNHIRIKDPATLETHMTEVLGLKVQTGDCGNRGVLVYNDPNRHLADYIVKVGVKHAFGHKIREQHGDEELAGDRFRDLTGESEGADMATSASSGLFDSIAAAIDDAAEVSGAEAKPASNSGRSSAKNSFDDAASYAGSQASSGFRTGSAAPPSPPPPPRRHRDRTPSESEESGDEDDQEAGPGPGSRKRLRGKCAGSKPKKKGLAKLLEKQDELYERAVRDYGPEGQWEKQPRQREHDAMVTRMTHLGRRLGCFSTTPKRRTRTGACSPRSS